MSACRFLLMAGCVVTPPHPQRLDTVYAVAITEARMISSSAGPYRPCPSTASGNYSCSNSSSQPLFGCLPPESMNQGLVQQYTSVLMAPNCGADLLVPGPVLVDWWNVIDH